MSLRHPRESRTSSLGLNAGKTLIQICLIWGLFLWLIPLAILRFGSSLGIAGFEPLSFVGWPLFGAFSFVGLWCASIFVIWGKGTPLPLDTATRLVVRGPYRVVRNPMALAGIGQGISVGLTLGSWLVILYSLAGALVWHFVARPWEERDLARRFGEPYLLYQKAVPLWIPRLSAYPRVEADHGPALSHSAPRSHK